MQALAYKAYGQVTQRTATGRSLEYTLFEQITHALQRVHDDGGANPAEWGDALYRNMQMWSIFATDLLSPENALPTETKSGLISLSEFVRRTSMQVLAGSQGILDLIDVNRTIMAGLDGSAASFEQGDN
ncbi:MAG: flagellar biosynthesis regulator FlaF [Hyphomonas sp.]|uniref:flagellar biosynthesis regulator FlaF n=1 Tax=Hyphomonas sp. TaxID=87 RepID=UPI0017AF9C58|nr:flagellar biosynthesis regulator FlaF [Hyphomonas sp.]MBA3067886.1 flagellar biosynthesis regulator FlaF [Hyphomonas sp.]MBU3921599.1 flagellar biosynthesis regulator FlaF [Alphaproteobacteria bacterium]MBU4062442.1 flagellar biosynthesis regulator FlaF [Alphaproteobacteria bacterium]MBU4165949.1 flagellar biosynthesis regulator FlaF [Alphaproteobacteria bacterium]